MPVPDGRHVCAAPCCNIMVPLEHLMCRPHWVKVPFHIQKKVKAAWARVHRDREGYRDAVAEAVLAVQATTAPAQERFL